VKAHYEIEVQTNPAEALAHARAGMGGHAGAGNQAFALQGNAVESADFKTQSFGALVIHAQAHGDGVNNTLNQIKTLQVITNADQDSYLEQSDWVSGTDEQGNPQGVLVLDFNGDGQIETATASANIWGLTPTVKGTRRNANNCAKGSDPNWLARVSSRSVAARPNAVSLAGYRALQASNDMAWRAAA
jgi:hypothetical protein